MSIVPATGAPKRTALWPEAWREIRLMLMSYLLRLMLWMCPVDPGTVPIRRETVAVFSEFRVDVPGRSRNGADHRSDTGSCYRIQGRPF